MNYAFGQVHLALATSQASNSASHWGVKPSRVEKLIRILSEAAVLGCNHMEKEGLHRVLEFLKISKWGEILVMDRHQQIKWMREE